MTSKQTKAFLAQFKQSAKRISKWPKWMQRESRIASASFPRRVA